MSAGDKEVLKALEEVTRRNVNTMIDYSKETRALLRGLQSKIELLENVVREQDKQLLAFRKMLAGVQSKVYQGGS